MLFYSLVLSENNTNENVNIISTSPSPPQQRPIRDIVDENSPKIDYHNHNKSRDIQSSPLIDEARTNISSSIGPAASTPSPSSPRHYKPGSLKSTQTYFESIQQHDTSPMLQVKTIKHKDEDKESITILTRSRASSVRHGEKRDTIATVRFIGDTSDENGTNYEETYF